MSREPDDALARQLEALRSAAILAVRPAIDQLELAGEDRRRFLGGLVTCEVAQLEPGEGRFGFVTGVNGKVLADVVVLATPERLRLELPPGRGAVVAAHLEKYKVADRVEVGEADDEAALWLAGPAAEAWLAAEAAPAAPPRDPWSHAEVELAAGRAWIQRRGEPGPPAFSLRLARDAAAALLERAAGGEAPLGAGAAALEVARVEDGVPRWGVDYDDDHFPQETGRIDGVSFDKGCYLGQEVVARIRYRGKVNRALRTLVVAGEALPPPGTAIELEGREVGRTGTAVRSPRQGRTLALAIVHRRAADPGTVVEIAGHGRAEVSLAPPAAGGAGSDGE